MPLIPHRKNIKKMLDYRNLLANAVFAGSLKKLTKTYHGYCIRVRRSSDNQEKDIGFAGNILDMNALISFVSTGNGFISILYDQSGKNNHAVQANSTYQPLIIQNGSFVLYNNCPFIKNDGSNDYLRIPSLENTAFPQTEFSVFMKAVNISSTSSGFFNWYIANSNTAWFQLYSSGQGVQLGLGHSAGVYNNTGRTNSVIIGQPLVTGIAVKTGTGGKVKYYISTLPTPKFYDSNIQNTSWVPSQQMARFICGSYGSTGLNSWLIFNKQISDTDFDHINRCLK